MSNNTGTTYLVKTNKSPAKDRIRSKVSNPLPAVIGLLLLVSLPNANAVIGSCSVNFPDGIQSNDAGGSVNFNFNAILLNNPDNQLATPAISQSAFDTDSCDLQGECSASGIPADKINLGAFPSNSGTTSLTVLPNQTQTLGDSGTNEYTTVQVNNRGTLNFSASFSEYHIQSLTLQGHTSFAGATLELSAGDYYISNFLVNSSNVSINVVGAGTARLFIENAFTINSNTLVNSPSSGNSGDPSLLLIYGYSDVNFSNATTTSAIVYAQGNSNLFSQSFLFGALSANNGILGFTSQVSFDSSAVNNADYGDICGAVSIAGLIGEWRFDELFWNGTNSEVLDSSGNDLHLTAFSAITDDIDPAISGDPGTCAYGVFNGSISFIQLNDDTSTSDSLLDIPDNLTVTTWINTNVIPSSGLKSILSKDENYEFHINTSGQIFWWWRWATLTTTGPSLSLNQWHHIAITWRSGEQVIYIDGVERARSSRTGSLDINNDPLQVGQDLNIASRFFDGEIDEVRIYENFLTAAEVNQVMNDTHPCTNAAICGSTFEDSFNAATYNNSTGSDPWNSDWIETDDDNSATGGNVFITGGELTMDDRPNSGGQPSLERELDLSSYLSAFISVDLATAGNLENSDRFDISASANGGASYTVLQSFSDSFSGNFSYDLTPFMSNNTRIRFRIENAYGGGGERIDIDNVVITGFKNCGPDHFRVLHDGAGINCLREAITIRAENTDNSVMTNYTGTININLSTNNGNWFVVDNTGFSSDPALGTLTDTAGDNDGFATYEFVPSDFGSVVLYLENTVAETTNIGVSENGITDDDSEGDITFRPFGFVFTPSPITTQIAGRPFDIILTAAGQTPAQAECGVIEEYTGNQSIDFWSTYSNPVTSSTFITVNGSNIAISEATASSQNVVFTAGIATISTQYDDVGQISISAKDEIDVGDPPSGNLDEIIGGISPFVVRPFGFDIQVTGAPFADDANDAIFASAGSNFNMTLRSVLWQSADDLNNDGIPDPFVDTDANAIPDTGGDLSDNGVTPNISAISPGLINLSPTALVITNSNGLLSTTNISFASFIADGLPNEATYTFSQSWDEVGILQIDTLSTDFMNGGENVTGRRINIGRFIPDHLLMSPPVIIEQCGSFTYAGFFDGTNLGLDKNGQAFDVSGNIIAQNLSNGTTQNYAGVFAKLNASDISLVGYNTTIASSASGRVNFSPAALNFVNGVSNYVDPAVDYQYDATAGPFSLRLDLSVTDSDSVTSGVVSSNAFEVRLGRMRIIDSYGPETDNLEMPLFTDYFDGTRWSVNTQDNCSTYIDSNVIFDLSSYTDQLNNGETSIFAPILFQSFINGISAPSNGLWFSPPGNNNFGSVLVELDLSTQSWLRFDWDADIILDNASARLNFGYYRGSDRVIYWKEIRN